MKPKKPPGIKNPKQVVQKQAGKPRGFNGFKGQLPGFKPSMPHMGKKKKKPI